MFNSQYAPMHLTLFNESIAAENEVRRHVFGDIQKQVASMSQEHSEPRSPLSTQVKAQFNNIFTKFNNEIDKVIQAFRQNVNIKDSGDVPLYYNQLAYLINGLNPSIISSNSIDINGLVSKMDDLVVKLRYLLKIGFDTFTDYDVLVDMVDNILEHNFKPVSIKVDEDVILKVVIKSKSFQDALNSFNDIFDIVKKDEFLDDRTDAELDKLNAIIEEIKTNVLSVETESRDQKAVESLKNRYISKIDDITRKTQKLGQYCKNAELQKKKFFEKATLYLDTKIPILKNSIEQLIERFKEQRVNYLMNTKYEGISIQNTFDGDLLNIVEINNQLYQIVNTKIDYNEDIYKQMYYRIDELTKQFDTINTKYEKFFNKTLQAYGLKNTEIRNNFYSEIMQGLTLSDDVVAEEIPPPVENLIPIQEKIKEGQDIQRQAEPSVEVEEALFNPADALVVKTSKKGTPAKAKEQSAFETPEQTASREEASRKFLEASKAREESKAKKTTPKKTVSSEEEKLKQKEEAVIQKKEKQEEVKQKEKEQKAKEAQEKAVAQQEEQLGGEGKPKRRIGKGRKKSKKPVMKFSSMFSNYLDDTDDKLIPNLPKKIVPYGL